MSSYSSRMVDSEHPDLRNALARLERRTQLILTAAGEGIYGLDAHGCATHRWVAHPLFQDLGSIILGNDASEEFLGTGGPGLGAKKL